jgi:hypothetical protein
MPNPYRIEVWSFPVLGASGPFSHRFLVDTRKDVMNSKPIGTELPVKLR